MNTLHIRCLLLVEDDHQEALSMTGKLSGASSLHLDDILVATSLAETIEVLFSRSDIDIVLLDLNLSDSQSLATLRAVRAVTDRVIIVLAETADEMLGVEALKMGADDFLVKYELTEKRLSQSIRRSMTRHKIRVVTERMHSNLQRLCHLTGVS